ncbi:MAG: hypothetical protein AAGE86_05230 [Pseudomonadota bacterium]
MRAVSILGLAAASLALQGCVAAIIPVVAGATMARTATDGMEPGDAERAAEQQQAALAARDGLVEIAAAPPPIAGLGNPSASAEADLAETDAYEALIRYAVEQSEASTQAALPQSAMLADPSTLRAVRAPCVTNIPTVLIDLDPDEGAITTDAVKAAPAEFIQGLARLREAQIDIAWISGQSAADAGNIRVALKQSGLDPDNKDRLLLMRYPGDRKQTRRRDLAKTSCVIAIAGDARTDFDELFEYLVNPEAALALELLIGQGWFLIPPALAPTSSQTALSTD